MLRRLHVKTQIQKKSCTLHLLGGNAWTGMINGNNTENCFVLVSIIVLCRGKNVFKTLARKIFAKIE